jgi:hypothetical protein
MITGCGYAVRLLGVSSLNLGRADVWPNFFVCLNAKHTILIEAGIGFKIGQSGDLIVDRHEIRLGRVERTGAASGDGLIERPNASFRLDEAKLRSSISSAPSHEAIRMLGADMRPSHDERRAERDRLAQISPSSSKTNQPTENCSGFTANPLRLVVSIAWPKVSTTRAIRSLLPSCACGERPPRWPRVSR